MEGERLETAHAIEEALRRARQKLVNSVSDIPAEIVRQRPSNTDWSILEVLSHLVDVDYFYLGEALAMKNQANYGFRYFDDEDWKRRHPTVPKETVAEILVRLQESQQAVLEALKDMSVEDLARQGKHPRGISYSVGQVFLRFLSHDANHENQIN